MLFGLVDVMTVFCHTTSSDVLEALLNLMSISSLGRREISAVFTSDASLKLRKTCTTGLLGHRIFRRTFDRKPS